MAARTGIRALRGRIAESQIKRRDIARVLCLSESALSMYLRGLRPMPKGMEEQILEALDLLERAECAAQEARERVLSEEDCA